MVKGASPMKAKVDIDAVIGGVRIHVKAGDQLPQALIDHWLVSDSMVRAIRQGWSRMMMILRLLSHQPNPKSQSQSRRWL
jgi:hypothetical protein